jgi:hypothetical protein
MQNKQVLLPLTLALIASAGAIGVLPIRPAGAETWAGTTITLSGRQVSCGKVDILLDKELPSEGGAGDDILVLNPDMLQKQPKIVRLFVFKHECGHLTVGDSELKADCYAVHQGVREGWLDRKGLGQVCDSFEGAPETDTHPSAKRRCANLDQCFAAAVAETSTASVKPAAPAAAAAKPDATASRKLSAWRCTDPLPVDGAGKDPIGALITADREHAKHCR